MEEEQEKKVEMLKIRKGFGRTTYLFVSKMAVEEHVEPAFGERLDIRLVKRLADLGYARRRRAKWGGTSKRMSAYMRLWPSLFQRNRVEVAPGYGLHRFLSSICPPKFRERELDALHADALVLYCETLKRGDKWGARRVRWSMTGWMLSAVFGGAVAALGSILTGKYKSPK